MFVENFPEGFFFIRCKHAKMALDVYAGGMLVRQTFIPPPPSKNGVVSGKYIKPSSPLYEPKRMTLISLFGLRFVTPHRSWHKKDNAKSIYNPENGR